VGPVPADEVDEVYRPLARLVADRARRTDARRPYLVGITGSVAVGKSGVAAVVASLLGEVTGGRDVAVVTTDSFLHPNAVLAARGLLDRKGFPESYDDRLQRETLAAVRSGQDPVTVPVYSHEIYDILPDDVQVIDHPDLVVVEGLNVLRAGGGDAPPDTSIYVDAAEADLARWFAERVHHLVEAAPRDGVGFYPMLATLAPDDLRQLIERTWTDVNLVNLHRHISPARAEADLVLWKGGDHRVVEVLVSSTWLEGAGQAGT
jgi:type I pantothenate kinase